MTKSFKDVIIVLPSNSPQFQGNLNNFIRGIIGYSIWDLYTYDPIMEDFIKTIGRNGLNDNVGVSNTLTLDNALA